MTNIKMKAAILYEQNKSLRIEELFIPELRKGQVLVKVIASGVDHSQLNEIKGKKGPGFRLDGINEHLQNWRKEK